jgi:hypothetical protein
MKTTVISGPTRSLSKKTKVFGLQRILVETHSFRRLAVGELVLRAIFGEGWNKLHKNEIVHESTNSMVAHISSSKRMESIFRVKDVCCSTYTLHGVEHYCACGKVAVSYGGKEIIGYITDEDENKWTIILQNNNAIEIDRVRSFVINKIMEKSQNYEYKNFIIGKIVNPVIVQYFPILVRVDMNSMQNMM